MGSSSETTVSAATTVSSGVPPWWVEWSSMPSPYVVSVSSFLVEAVSSGCVPNTLVAPDAASPSEVSAILSSCFAASVVIGSVTVSSLSVMMMSSVPSSTLAKCSSMAVKSTPSLMGTVSNCENGRFTNSRMALSGVNETLSRPSMTMGSPVFTSTLLREATGTTLNVPNPLTFTCRSVSMPLESTSNIFSTNCSAASRSSPYLSTSARESSLNPILLMVGNAKPY